MALSKKTQTKIDKATRRMVNYMRYRAVGPHVLTRDDLKDLVRAGLIRPGRPPKNAVAQAYLKTFGKLSPTVPPVATRDRALDFLEALFNRYSKKLAEGLSADVLNMFDGNLAPMIDRAEGKAVYGLLKDPAAQGKYLGNVLSGVVKNWENRWRTIVNTELSRASNFGAADAITANNKPDGRGPNEISVYKIGPLDGVTCPECRKFWYNADGTPKVYRLSELQANGTNIGKKKLEWRATIDSTHPNCRHELAEVRAGFGFRGRRLEYIGKAHDAFSTQQGKKP